MRAGGPRRPERCLGLSQPDIEQLASAARELAPSASVYLEQDYVMNLFETVLDYMLQTEVVVKQLRQWALRSTFNRDSRP